MSEKHIAALRQIQEIVSEALKGATGASGGKRVPAPQKAAKQSRAPAQMSFDMSPLAFMNKYARGLSGPKKFTLLLARLVKGSTSAQVASQDIESHWNKMKTVLDGRYRAVYGNRANAAGWVELEKARWKLTSAWKEALN